MKKLLIYVSAIGLSAGVVFWLCKKAKNNNSASKAVDNKVDLESETQAEEIPQDANVAEKMYQAKGENAQTVGERHAEAAAILKDAYRNIMEDFVEDFSVDQKEENKTKEVLSNDETFSVLNELDSISDELDTLLK